MKNRITNDMMNAMRNKDSVRLGVIRLLLSAIKQKEVDSRVEQTDNDILGIINKMIKQRNESIAAFTTGNRPDLVTIEQNEIDILKVYVPEQLGDDEVIAYIDTAFSEIAPKSIKDMGAVLSVLKTRLGGKADMGKVSAMVKQRLMS